MSDVMYANGHENNCSQLAAGTEQKSEVTHVYFRSARIAFRLTVF
jgi:hypothetical protein